LQAKFQEMMQAQLAAQDAAHQQNLEAVAGHYQRQIVDLSCRCFRPATY
jgi:hypothetical protein